MSPFAALGLSESADEARIKRAYAKLLRENRPDDDPDAFQRLHQAYTRCLEWARRREAQEKQRVEREPAGEESEAGMVPAIATPTFASIAPNFAAGAPNDPIAPSPPNAPGQTIAPDRSDAEPRFELERFLDELIRTAQASSPEALQHWLDRHPNLYALAQRQAVANALVAHLSEAPTLYLKQLDTLLRFFNLDTVGERHSPTPLRVEELRALAKARGGDFREIRFERNPTAGARGKHPFPWPTHPFFYLVAALLAIMLVLILVTPE